MTAGNNEPIWFNPPRFWDATKGMSPSQIDLPMDRVMFLAEIRDLNALRNFEVIGIGHSYILRNPPARRTELQKD